MSRGLLCFSAVALALAAATACAPIDTYNGFLQDRNNAPQDPQVGVDTRQTVEDRFGTPSTVEVLDNNAWYYISAVQEHVAFYTPHITDRHVLVVRFNGDTVSAVERYGLERGRIIAYDAHETPTRGRELGIIEQLLGTIGSSSPLPPDQDQENQDHRRGGGP
jgi:outer membrane protein assembly factor BamE (lipoprotein component of BamABCDE complex)